MSVKVTISYERPEELEKILKLLRPVIKSCKVARSQKGPFKKAYADLGDVDNHCNADQLVL